MVPSAKESTKLLDAYGEPAQNLRLNILSHWTYWWILKTIRKGYNRPLSDKDVHNILPEFASKGLRQRLESKRKRKGKASGVEAAWRILPAFPTEIAQTLLSFSLMHCARLVQPYMLGAFLDYLSRGTLSDNVGYTYAGILVLSAVAYVFLNMHSFYMGEILGMCLKGAYSSALYSKILKMGPSKHQNITSGYVINLFGTDLECVCSGVPFFGAGITSVFSMAVSIVLLCGELGWCFLVGVTLSGVFLIVSTIFGRQYGKLRTAIAESSDYRVQLMNEIMPAIRVIKMYCWEEFFQQNITKTRREEMRCVGEGNVLSFVATGFSSAQAVALPAVMLINYYAVGHQLTASKVFKTMLYCTMIQTGGLFYIPEAIKRGGQLIRSLERIEGFLTEVGEESLATAPGQKQTLWSASKVAVRLDRVTASWDSATDSKEQVCQLKDITLTCEQGSLTAAVGSVGAGKTSLLMLLAGKMPHQSGQLTRNGDISYCPQDAWIFQDTLQQNILFGEDMHRDRYTKVVEACGLVEDISNMDRGDLTLIGDRGITLSGGQRARVSLARALYRNADIYLLDDPLSAVDSKVGRHILKRAVKTFLEGKTRILVTHRTRYLVDMDQIVVLRQGFANCVCSMDEVVELPASQLTENECPQQQLFTPSEDLQPERLADSNERGNVSWAVYYGLIRAGGTLYFLACLLLYAFTKCVTTSAAWFLSEWTSKQEQSKTNQTLPPPVEAQQLLHIYVGLASAGTLLSTVSLIPLAHYLATASKNLHNSMFFRVMRAPMHFFDVTPTGIVINRFSRDLGFVDLLLPLIFSQYIVMSFLLLGQMIVICIVLPWLLIATFVLSIMLYAVYRFCLRAFRDLKRLEASARSPVFSHLSETLDGLQNIRIFKKEDRFMTRFNEYQDHSTMCWLMCLTCFRWLGMILSLAVVIFLALTVTLVVLLKGEISTALLGLCLTYVLSALEVFEYAFRCLAKLETHMTSVERILYYAQLEQEPAAITDCRPSASWPEAGCIQFHDVSLYYREGQPPALKNVSFIVRPREKVGIVGRTGSGKSSLLQALMRLTEAHGCIFIDGVDIMKIGLLDLREKIPVIPQNPVLINGTVKQNLDPAGNATDDEVWQALRKAQLFEKVASMNGKLNAVIHQRGSNLSVGQKQLMCLARALLRGNKILILDEATANIDRATDRMIQVAIRAYFSHCTILIIAHRLETIMDCNNVMVLDEGCLKEYDNPYLLLSNEESLLSTYARQLGEEGFASCVEIAKEAFVNRLN